MGLKEWSDKTKAQAIERQAKLAVTTAERKTKADASGYFQGVHLSPDGIKYKGQGGPLSGATAHVETAADAGKRVTGARLLALGVFAFAAKKSTGHLYLTVEGDGFEFVVEVPIKAESDARKFAAKINNAGRVAA